MSENTKSTAIQILLDRSGSMESIKKATEEGLASFLQEQRAMPGDCSVRLSQFDHEYEVVHPLKPIADVSNPVLQPRGRTALLDAWGRAMVEFAAELAGNSVQPDVVIFIVMTDGLENDSREWTKRMINAAVQEKTESGWQFIYLGANQDAIAESRGYGITQDSALTFQPTGQSVGNTYAVASSAVTTSRRGGRVNFSEEDRRRVDGSTS